MAEKKTARQRLEEFVDERVKAALDKQSEDNEGSEEDGDPSGWLSSLFGK